MESSAIGTYRIHDTMMLKHPFTLGQIWTTKSRIYFLRSYPVNFLVRTIFFNEERDKTIY